MNKPNNYENTQIGDFTPVELGGHYAIIKQVSERTNKNGGPMVVVCFDFDKTDAQPEMFATRFREDIRPDKKWPNQAIMYINTEDKDGKCSRSFKKFVTAFADSNGLKENDIKWGSDFCAQFKNKKIGVVFGNVEEEYNGEVKMRRKARWWCDYKKAKDQTVPADVLLENKPAPATKTNNDGFMNIPTGDGDELPFD